MVQKVAVSKVASLAVALMVAALMEVAGWEAVAAAWVGCPALVVVATAMLAAVLEMAAAPVVAPAMAPWAWVMAAVMAGRGHRRPRVRSVQKQALVPYTATPKRRGTPCTALALLSRPSYLYSQP